ncbi:hypothetical protein N3K66_005867 [Trichothecium roseum]|uniref:Uncharacterized protein n=1 Tax=Trichothecium roseum TaxID=47278 RepID=A0ACC0UZ79_9HYPO|nr:hypothetical protein N3K66_005867 [Trichothecium roseum]
MGGSAFNKGTDPLHTPRMPRCVYLHVKKECTRILQTLYVTVESPIDGPDKVDYGDVDILVQGPKTATLEFQESMEKIGTALGASRSIIEKGDVASHFALQWPSRFANEIPRDEADGSQKASHVQVDVKICKDLQELQWVYFKHSHGDAWSILGSIIRPYGITIDTTAMWIRVPEIEAADRKRARVFLTDDIAETLNFLGLSHERFFEGEFESLQDMFDYTTSCRMFWVRPKEPESDPVPNKEAPEPGISGNPGQLTSNDRRRMKQRPAFAMWQNEFIPKCREMGLFLEKVTAREKVTEEALEKFGAREQFENRRDNFLREQQRDRIKNQIIIPAVTDADDGNQDASVYRSCLVSALKRIILEGDEEYGVLPEASLKDDNDFFDQDKVADFIKRRKDEVGKAAFAILKQNREESRKQKQSSGTVGTTKGTGSG